MGGSPNCTLLGSLTGQKCEKETEINIPPCSHRQVFSLLYNHLSALVPHTPAKLWTCSSAGLQALLLLFPSPCVSIPMSCCPSQPLPPSFRNLFFIHVRFSAEFAVQPLQHFYDVQDRAVQRQEEIAGGVPASAISALPIHVVAPLVPMKRKLCCRTRNIFKCRLRSRVLLDVLKLFTASSSEDAIRKQVPSFHVLLERA